MTKAEDVLSVLAGVDVATEDLRFTVVTDAAPVRRDGEVVGKPSFWPFEEGEIIVNYGDGGREAFGEGRKPDKWDVAVESFETLAEAQDCRRKVLAGEWPRAYADWHPEEPR